MKLAKIVAAPFIIVAAPFALASGIILGLAYVAIHVTTQLGAAYDRWRRGTSRKRVWRAYRARIGKPEDEKLTSAEKINAELWDLGGRRSDFEPVDPMDDF